MADGAAKLAGRWIPGYPEHSWCPASSISTAENWPPSLLPLVFGGGCFTTVTVTGVTPCSVMPNCSAVPFETSTTRPGALGPRSVTLTRADRPFLRLVTLTVDPSGMCLAAAVCPSAWNVVPLAVFFPSNRRPYQLALPRKVPGRTLRLARACGASLLHDGRMTPTSELMAL
jgi:hypothetical protein